MDGVGAVRIRACALAAAERLVVSEALAGERQVVHRALPLSGSFGGSPQRRQDQVGHAARRFDVSGHHRGREPRVQQAARWRFDLDRAERAGRRRSVGIGQDPHREERRRLRHGQRAVEVSVDLRIGAAEVEGQVLAVDRRGYPEPDIALGAIRVVLEHVLCFIGAVRKLGEPCLRTALGVVEDLRNPVPYAVQPVALDQLQQPPLSGEVRRPLRPQVRQALRRVPHLVRHPLEHFVAHPRWWDHHALVLQSPGVGRHAAGGRAADVRVVGAARREAERT